MHLEHQKTTVTDIRLYSRENARSVWQIALDQTPFSAAKPHGTLTATAPSGAVLVVEVESVSIEDAGIWHLTHKPLPIGSAVVAEAFGEAERGC